MRSNIKSKSSRLQIEALERRDVPAGDISLVGSVLTITGSDQADTAQVSYDNRGTVSLFDDRLIASLAQANSSLTRTYNLYRALPPVFGQVGTKYEKVITQIAFTGVAGADSFLNNGQLPAQADGGEGNDVLTGGIASDTLNGGAGDDQLAGGDAADSLDGGSGNDILRGDASDDRLFGRSGNDMIFGGDGADWLEGNENSDLLYGQDGNDWLDGGSGTDKLYGYAGADLISGGSGNDQLFGGTGNDVLSGDAGNDWLEAGTSAEQAIGGDGEDFNAHIWAINGANRDDIDQQGSPTCVFLATLSSVAMTGCIDLANRISYIGNFTYRVQLYNDDGAITHQDVRFDGNYTMFGPGPAFDGGDVFYDTATAVEGESWVILTQRAYAQQMAAQDMVANNDYRNSEIAHQAITGEVGTRYVRADFDVALFNTITADIAAGDRSLIACTRPEPGQLSTDRLVANHAYSIICTRVDGNTGGRFITLRNPWAWDGGNPVGDPNDALVEISWTDFCASFNYVYVGSQL